MSRNIRPKLSEKVMLNWTCQDKITNPKCIALPARFFEQKDLYKNRYLSREACEIECNQKIPNVIQKEIKTMLNLNDITSYLSTSTEKFKHQYATLYSEYKDELELKNLFELATGYYATPMSLQNLINRLKEYRGLGFIPEIMKFISKEINSDAFTPIRSKYIGIALTILNDPILKKYAGSSIYLVFDPIMIWVLGFYTGREWIKSFEKTMDKEEMYNMIKESNIYNNYNSMKNLILTIFHDKNIHAIKEFDRLNNFMKDNRDLINTMEMQRSILEFIHMEYEPCQYLHPKIREFIRVMIPYLTSPELVAQYSNILEIQDMYTSIQKWVPIGVDAEFAIINKHNLQKCVITDLSNDWLTKMNPKLLEKILIDNLEILQTDFKSRQKWEWVFYVNPQLLENRVLKDWFENVVHVHQDSHLKSSR